MEAAGKIDENELYLIEDESTTKVSVEPALTSGVEIATIVVDEIPYKIYVPEASKIEVTRHITTGEKIATITLNGISEDIYAPKSIKYTAGNGINISNDNVISSTVDYSSELALKADLNNPAFTGVPTAPTADIGTNNT
jgi:hypothetical protein